MQRLSASTYHSFITAEPWSVILATGRSGDTFNAHVAAHFGQKYGARIGLAVLALSADCLWFDREVRAAIRRHHAHFSSAYYLIVNGRIAERHSGNISGGAGYLWGAAICSVITQRPVESFESANDAYHKHVGSEIVGLFEGVLARRPPPNDVRLPAVSNSSPSPFELLEIAEGATRGEIDAAYKKRAAEYHPDRVASLGRDLRELAERRMIEINVAYAQLTRRPA